MIKLKRLVLLKGKEWEIKDNQQVYEINLQTGMILLAPLTFKEEKPDGQKLFTIEEKGMCLYMPGVNKEEVKIKYNAALAGLKNDKRNNSSSRK